MKISTNWLGMFLAVVAFPGWGASTETTATQVFSKGAPAIVVVKTFNAKGGVLGQGSGVVIANDVIVTNCHVYEKAGTSSIGVFYGHQHFTAQLRFADPNDDLCSFNVHGLPAQPAKMHNAGPLSIGEKVYSIGAAGGLNLALASGTISALRTIQDGAVIQITVPIPPDSSGGGLFDSDGLLVGVTSYYASAGKSFYFALPVELIKTLPLRGETPAGFASRPVRFRNEVRQGSQALLSGDYKSAFAIFDSLAVRNSAVGQFALGLMYNFGEGVSQNDAKAFSWYQEAAKQGYFRAEYNLALLYHYGQGTPQDDTKARYRFQKAAAQGIAIAQHNLGVMYYEGQGTQQNYAEAFGWFQKAADAGFASSQYNLGVMYGEGLGVARNDVQSAKWLLLAESGGDKGARTELSKVEQTMPHEEVVKTQRLARRWSAHHQY